MLDLIASLSENSRIYLALRYGINPWNLVMKPNEIAELLGVTPAVLNIIRLGTIRRLSSNEAHAIFEQSSGKPLTHPSLSSRLRKDHRKRLRKLEALSRTSYLPTTFRSPELI